jgi:Kef-type K+ transport system membrane component KefB
MKKVIYIMMIIMGAIIEIYDLKMDNPISVYFGGAAIGYGSFAIVVDYLKEKRKANTK